MNEQKTRPETSQKDAPKAKLATDKPSKELGGRDGLDPVRYGDWENKGIASDF